MTFRTTLRRWMLQEDLNFLLTNRLPRRSLTLFMGWFSQIEHPWVRDASIAVWKWFTDLDLSDARETQFKSLHACFTRELQPGARKVDPRPEVLCSPSDAILGAHGPVCGQEVFQAKGYPYSLGELLGDGPHLDEWRDGSFATLRLTSSMYHRFHAPMEARVQRLRYFSGDTWNVNPIALRRVEKLFCKNERACLEMRVEGTGPAAGHRIAIVPVAAILVASIRLHFFDTLLHLRYAGPREVACDALFQRGQEMGWFQHGSTLIVLAPKGFQICAGLQTGDRLSMGAPLMHWSGLPSA